MEIISRISKGSKMDQIYIPKNREGLTVGSYVVISPLDAKVKQKTQKPYFYNIKSVEPIKLGIISQIIATIDKIIKIYENIIITGSFLDKGFNFNDIDIIIIGKEKINIRNIEKIIENRIKIKTHIILLDNKTLIKGLSTDPLYQVMLSKCIAKKRFIYKIKKKVNYKLLDLHFLKSKTLIDNFDMLNGNEKYNLIRNLIAISLYLKKRKVDKEQVDKHIVEYFNIKIEEIKQNMLKKDFLKKYRSLYNKTFNKIMQGIKSEKRNKNASEQK